MNENTQEGILTLGQGNPGAMRVCHDLVTNFGEDPLIALGELGITGEEVWYLFKDECGESYEATAQCLTDGTAMAKLRGNRYSKFFSQ